MGAEKTIFERMGARCALCALWPRLEVIARLRANAGGLGRLHQHGMSAFEVFALGWFFGRYLVDAPNLCDDHRNFVEHVLPEQARAGGIVLIADTTLAQDVDLHKGRPPLGG